MIRRLIQWLRDAYGELADMFTAPDLSPGPMNFYKEQTHAYAVGITDAEIYDTLFPPGIGTCIGRLYRDALIVRYLWRLAAVGIGPERRGRLLHGISMRYAECFGAPIPNAPMDRTVDTLVACVARGRLVKEERYRLIECFPQFHRDLGNEPTVDDVLQWFLAPLDKSAPIP